MSANEPVFRDGYEVIVVGAGIGGLACAAVLACQGVDVMVLERGSRPGGCCQSFRSDGFTFDAGPTIFQGFGEIGFNTQRALFDFAGQQVDVMARESAYTMYFGDEPLEFHLDRHAFTSELSAIFPHQAGSVIAFIRELDRLYNALLDCSGPLRPRDDEPALQRWGLAARHPLSLLAAYRQGRRSADQFLAQHTDAPMVRALFDADLFLNTGYRISELSSAHAALTLMDRHVGGTHYPVGSSQQLPDRLEKVIIERGGQVALRVGVEEITVEGGRACGVRLEGGRRLNSQAVISNSTAPTLFGKLLKREHLTTQTAEWLDSLVTGAGSLTLYLGVDESKIPERFNPNTVIVPDPEREPDRYVSISVPSLLDPNLAREGHHCITIHSVSGAALWPRPSDAGYGSEDYERLKEDEASRVLGLVESRLLPGLGSSPRLMITASPSTFERYTGREGGATAGPRVSGGLSPVGLTGAVTCVKGLFAAGDSTFFGRGVANAAASGINCALAALRYIGISEPRFEAPPDSSVLETVPIRPQISGTDVVDTISAVLESHRCLFCEDAPCVDACPALIDIPTMVRRVGSSNQAGASLTVRMSNPLGESCASVCPAGALCELACSRVLGVSPVRIARLEEIACGYAQGSSGWPPPYPGARKERVAVIGSGPAGTSCAFFLSLLGYSVEVFEAGTEAGGLPSQAMPGFKLSRGILEREMEGAMSSGIEFRGNTTFGEDINFESLWREGFRAIFLGTGLRSVRAPDMKGLELPGVIDALSFLEAARRQVKRELTERVAVLGGGRLAFDTARLACDLGVDRVFIVTEAGLSTLAAAGLDIEPDERAHVSVLAGRRPMEVVGEGRVQGLRTVPLRSDAVPIPGSQDTSGPHLLDVGTVILAGEREPDQVLRGYITGHIKTSSEGMVLVDAGTMMTSQRGVFAGGDLVDGGGLVVTACAHGRKAALAIDRYLRQEEPR